MLVQTASQTIQDIALDITDGIKSNQKFEVLEMDLKRNELTIKVCNLGAKETGPYFKVRINLDEKEK